MRIYNVDTNKKSNRVTLYLTHDEAKEMKDALEALLKDGKKHHEHIPDKDFNKEITVCIYREDDLSSFDERSKKLIRYDE
jgi:hypothetical protein